MTSHPVVAGQVGMHPEQLETAVDEQVSRGRVGRHGVRLLVEVGILFVIVVSAVSVQLVVEGSDVR